MVTETRLTVNRSHRIHGSVVRWIVMHNDGSPSEQATIDWIANPKSEVSYHVYVRRDGSLMRFVSDEFSAWACGGPGKSAWAGINGVNSWTLSISFANRNNGKELLTDAQIAAAKTVIAEWRRLYPNIEGVITHKMCATPAGRKIDPEAAPNFDLSVFV